MAFEHITLANRAAEFEAKRDAFLLDPLSDALFAARCSGLYGGSVRYVREDAGGAGDGTANTSAGAWTLAQFVTAQGAWPSGVTKVVFTGKFSLSNAAAAATTVSVSNLLLDFREATYISGRILTNASQISAGETVGEYKIANAAVSATQPNVAMSVNGRRLGGWSKTQGFGAARLEISSVDTGADTVTFDDIPFALQNGDLCGTNNGTLGGVTHGTPLYVVNAGTWTAGAQTVQFSLTEGGDPIDLTSYSSPTYVHTLYSGRNNIPVPGALQDDEFAYVPWLDTVYFKPAGGYSEANDEIVLRQVGATDGLQITGANVHVLGGEFYNSTTILIVHNGSGASRGGCWGVLAHGSLEGIKAIEASHVVHHLCEVYDCANQGAGGYTAADAENGITVTWCYIYNLGRKRTDFGDFQHIVCNQGTVGAYIAHNVCGPTTRVSNIEPYVTLERTIAATGCVVLDSSADCVVFDNYLSGSNKLVELSLQTPQIERVLIHGNVFDMRELPECESGFIKSPQGIKAGQSATGTALDNTVIIANNLFLMSSETVQVDGQTNPGGCIMLGTRDSGNTLNPAFYNNVIYNDTETNVPCYALRRVLADAPWPDITADGNVFAGLQWIAVRFDEEAAIVNWPDTPYTAYATLADWQTLSGQDANSIETDADTAASWFDAYGRPVAGSALVSAGVHVRYLTDPNGRLRRNPPTVGIYEV